MGLISLLLLMAADQTRVVDPAAKPVAQARVRATTIAGSPVFTGLTDAQGEFPRPKQPNLIVEVEAPGFAVYRGPLQDEIRLTLEPVASTLHVTASPGAVEAEGVTRTVEGPHAAAALAGTPGVLLQQTGTSQVSPFLRGLTGYQVLNLIDGVRFNNSTFRSGPNQYLAFVEPSQAERIEAVLGPTSAQYGSDALGGTLQLFTPVLRDGFRGEWNVFAASADLSAGTDAKVSFPAGSRISLLAGVSGRKHNDLRAGQGTDSRHALRRFLGLNPSQIRDVTGSRQQDTGFTQYGLHTKLLARLTPQQWLSAWYQHSRQDNVRNSKDLWGGLGRLQSALAPQGLDFGYLRYERLALAGFDSVSATFSVNSQRDGTVRQGLRATDAIIVDVNRVDSYGWSAQASTRWTARHQLVFGGEFYQEQISATRLQNSRAVRPLYPDASRYRNGGAFLQDRWQVGRLRLNGGLRWTGAGYRTREDTRLGVAASQQSFGDLTFNASALWQATSVLGFHATIGRGFRAPNANDLGAVGLNDLGYEVPASLAVPAGALLGNNAGEAATSLGRAVTPLAPERLFNYEAGLRLTTSRFEWRTQVFLADLYDPIVRRTLLFPATAAPREVAGLPVTLIAPTAAQRAQGVVTVASAFDVRALKAFVNDGRSRYYGIESTSRYQLTQHWTGEASYAFLVGRDLLPNRNIRRLPPQQGLLRLRYTRSRWWMSVWSEANGAQRRLSGGDFDDERIGASRSRADMEAFWNGARLGGVSPTGETLAQIQNRLLPGLANNVRVPLYNSTAGWVTLNTAAGFSLTDRVTLSGGVNNWLDRNYRFHGSGIDAPGLLVSASLRYRF